MDPGIKQTYDEYFAQLTPVHQQALQSIDWQTKTIELGHAYGLHIDELEDLIVETMLVLIGANTADQYPAELKERVPLPPAELDRLTDDIAAQVFTPIHDRIVGELPNTQGAVSTPVTQEVSVTPVAKPLPTQTALQAETQMNRDANIQIVTEPVVESPSNIHPDISPNTMIRAGIAPDMSDSGDIEAENAPQEQPPAVFSDQLRQILSGTTGTQDRTYPVDGE